MAHSFVSVLLFWGISVTIKKENKTVACQNMRFLRIIILTLREPLIFKIVLFR
jgi:hypothetical protein